MDGAKGKSKSMSKSAPPFAKGGSGKMFGKQSVGTKTPGVSGKSDTNGGGMFAKGGNGKMSGKNSAVPTKAK
jgi:hypothetical protein